MSSTKEKETTILHEMATKVRWLHHASVMCDSPRSSEVEVLLPPSLWVDSGSGSLAAEPRQCSGAGRGFCRSAEQRSNLEKNTHAPELEARARACGASARCARTTTGTNEVSSCPCRVELKAPMSVSWRCAPVRCRARDERSHFRGGRT